MKMIIAMIRIDKMNETKQALSDAGMPSFMAAGKALGRGQGWWDARVMEGAHQDQPEALEKLGPEPPLRPQRVITLVVHDSKKDAAVRAIIKANQTGNHGDGKIYVLPVDDAVRVRTGEIGDVVLD